MTRLFTALALLSSIVSSVPLTPIQSGQRLLPFAGHWRVTDSETLWTKRYNNEDYGYSVLLGDGVIAHGEHPPNPNHGFLIPLPDVSKTTFASYETEKRYLSVYVYYDVAEDQSLAGAADDFQKTQATTKPSGSVKRTSTKLAGVPAIETEVETSSSSGTVIDTSIVAVRCNIVYTISLHTSKAELSNDERLFRALLDGFRWLKYPRNECGKR